MAISFSGISSNLTLTSQVGDIKVSCGIHESVHVEMCNPGGSVVLAERFYAVSGWVTLHGIGELCESALRERGISFGEFELSATADGEQATAVLRLIYCDRFTPYSDNAVFFSENFLTTCNIRRIPRGSDTTLALFAKSGETLKWRLAVPLRDPSTGALRVATWQYPTPSRIVADGVYFINVLWTHVLSAVRALFPTEQPEVGQFTVFCGQRSVTFFIDASLRASDTFHFRNCFNIREAVTLPTLSTAKTVVEQSLAVVNGQTRHYNRHATQAFEVECGPLLMQEALWLEQLVTSHEVVRIEPYALEGDDDERTAVPVLITDFTCEMHDGDDKLNTLKFTWRYADNRPLVRLSAPTNYFTEQYTPTFS